MSIIAISRGTLGGGEALAKRVAERLGYQCLGREANLEAASKRYSIPAEQLAAAMERRPSFLERVIGERAAYLTFVRATLCEQTRGDNLVYHGYLGQLLLPGISHVIAVRVISDPESRIQAAMKKYNFSHKDAITHVERADQERREWTRFLFGVDWHDPRHYDIVLNLSRMSLATACATVVALTERDEFKPTAASVKAMRDLTLQSRVLAALAMDFRTRDASLKVTADDGIVTIAGTTRWPEVVGAVPSVVRQVDGVKDIRSEVTGATPASPLTWY